MEDNTKFFSVDARTIFQLGKEAIEDEMLAISELVKNAYDADAQKCSIDFISSLDWVDDKRQEVIEQIIIIDDGSGMSFHDVEKNWLRIGTTNKKQETFTKNNRRKIGEKGIGRLALNRLGGKIDIYSKKKNSIGVHLSIDFFKFKANLDIQNIPVELSEFNDDIEGIDPKGHGTVIRISQLEDTWNDTKINTLTDRIKLLQNPYGKYKLNEDNELEEIVEENDIDFFEIKVEKNGELIENSKESMIDFLNFSIFRMYCEINTQTNKISYRYSFNPYDKMSKLKKTTKKEEEKEIKLKEDRQLRPIVDKSDLGIIKIELFGYDFSSTVNALSTYANISKLKKTIRNFGGVKVFRDNQRVYNYGEPTSDWLELDKKRVNRPGNFLSNNVLIGVVSLNRDDSTLLEEKTNREGFINSSAFQKFKDIVFYSVTEFSSLVADDKNRIKKYYAKTKKTVNDDEIYDNLIETIDSAAISYQIKEEIKSGVYLYKEQMDYIKNVLINVSINTMDYLTIFHDLENQIDKLKEYAKDKIKDNSLITDLTEINQFVKTHNDIIRDKEVKRYKINDMIYGILFEERYPLKNAQIEVVKELKMTENMEFDFHRASVKRIFNNVLNNSIYWTSANERRIIKVRTEITNDELIIFIDDNGMGFQGDIEHLEEPFVTKKTGDTPGIGLGLFIIKQLMKNSKGYVNFNNNSEIESGSARVELHFPK